MARNATTKKAGKTSREIISIRYYGEMDGEVRSGSRRRVVLSWALCQPPDLDLSKKAAGSFTRSEGAGLLGSERRDLMEVTPEL